MQNLNRNAPGLRAARKILDTGRAVRDNPCFELQTKEHDVPYLRFSVIVLLVGVAFPSVRAEDPALAKRLTAIIDGPDYKHAKWGIHVVDTKTGEVVFSRNSDKLCTPASTTKLYTCANAIISMGADSRIVTPVHFHGSVNAQGVLDGDLILVGKGDLTFGGRAKPDGKAAFKNNDHTYANSGLSEADLTGIDPRAELNAMANQVFEAGIREVSGEVLVDDRLFEKTRGSGSGPDAVTPIFVNDNVVDIVVSAGGNVGDAAKVKLIPETDFLRADLDITTGKAGSGTRITILNVGPNHFSVRGSIAIDAKPNVKIYPVEDPALFARGLFIEALRKAGVRVAAAVQKPESTNLPAVSTYSDDTMVAANTSPPLKEALKVTLKVSHNLYASTLPCLVAVSKGKSTAIDGLREQRRVLRKLGVDVEDISFGGGAGGSPADCVTPKATVQLLVAMAKRPEWEIYKSCLPVIGIDGTLASVVSAESAARGHVFAKTGTLIYNDGMNGRSLLRSKALAGVMKTAKGTDITFAMFVNNVPLPLGVGSSREGKVLGKLCEAIYESGP